MNEDNQDESGESQKVASRCENDPAKDYSESEGGDGVGMIAGPDGGIVGEDYPEKEIFYFYLSVDVALFQIIFCSQ